MLQYSIQQLLRGEKTQSWGGEVVSNKGYGQHNFERYSITLWHYSDALLHDVELTVPESVRLLFKTIILILEHKRSNQKRAGKRIAYLFSYTYIGCQAIVCNVSMAIVMRYLKSSEKGKTAISKNLLFKQVFIIGGEAARAQAIDKD